MKPVKIVVGGVLYCRHPRLGWLRLGSWGWEPVVGPPGA
jgi:hypothetical protein